MGWEHVISLGKYATHRGSYNAYTHLCAIFFIAHLAHRNKNKIDVCLIKNTGLYYKAEAKKVSIQGLFPIKVHSQPTNLTEVSHIPCKTQLEINSRSFLLLFFILKKKLNGLKLPPSYPLMSLFLAPNQHNKLLIQHTPHTQHTPQINS